MEWKHPETVLDGLPAGTRYVASNCCGTPSVLLDALPAHAIRTGGTHTLTAGLLLGDHDLEPGLRSGNLCLRSWHIHGQQRALWEGGLVEYLPLRLGDLSATVLPGTDVALIRVGLPNEEGWCTFGPSATFSQALVAAARLVVAEVAEDVPRIPGAAAIHVSKIDRAVRSDRSMPVYPPSPSDETAAMVAHNVVDLLPEWAVLQFGIGAVGGAVAHVLASGAGPRSFGLVGMLTDGMIPLAERITADGRGPVQVLEVMGGPGLMAWASDSPCVEMASSAVLHAPVALAQRPSLYSINSAIAIDLTGQVVSESVRGRVLAGVGGSFDFFEGAHLSKGGRRVLAMRSTTRRGDSTIVPRVPAGDAVAVPRHSVDVVVTEHGAARLTGHTEAERRDLLVDIAAPEHRDALRRDATHAELPA